MTAVEQPRSPWPALAVALLAFGSWAWIHRPERPEPEHDEPQPEAPVVYPYGELARALLGGLEPGESLADGWVVERIQGPLPDGRIEVVARRGEVSFAAWLVPAGQSPHRAPIATERWELFYDHPTPPDASVSEAEQVAVLELLAARAREREDAVDAR